ncbi:hypothetical protein DNTS_028408 [Danionella cerebrum]|uniref:RING-type E3 ubiquitin transferase n=1 Tax=Danionella cerebrum TaxID=2873325 RepID=A0A553N2T1_9TELE|nr:hypothetical protein DNTS_028408 [Danionella translucida]
MSDSLFHPIAVVCAGSCVAFSAVFYKLYSEKKIEIQKLKELEVQLELLLLSMLLRVLKSTTTRRLHYAAVEGLVQAVGEPISSQFVPRCNGVIQKITLHEHWKHWNPLLNDVCVRVDSPLEASGDYLQRVHRRTRNASEGLVGSVLGELSGQRPVAQEECEEMLRVGETLTGFGEVVLEGETIRLKPPVDGRAYVLMPGDHRSFIQRHEASAGMWKGLSVLFGMAGVTLIAGLVHRGVRNIVVITKELIFILFLLFIWVMEGQNSACSKSDVWTHHHLQAEPVSLVKEL